jgi:hypothetical protein
MIRATKRGVEDTSDNLLAYDVDNEEPLNSYFSSHKTSNHIC